MDRRKQDLARTLMLMAMTAIVTGTTSFWLGRATLQGQPPELFPCTLENRAGEYRCPPEAGLPVMGYWSDGSSATIAWDGRQWRLVVPGGGRTVVRYPNAWYDPRTE